MVDAVIEHVKHEVRPRARCFFEERAEAKGEQRGRAELLVRLLEHRFGELSAELRSRVQAASIQELDDWGLRLVSVATLEDVFAEPKPPRRSKRRRHRGKPPEPSPG